MRFYIDKHSQKMEVIRLDTENQHKSQKQIANAQLDVQRKSNYLSTNNIKLKNDQEEKKSVSSNSRGNTNSNRENDTKRHVKKISTNNGTLLIIPEHNANSRRNGVNEEQDFNSMCSNSEHLENSPVNHESLSGASSSEDEDPSGLLRELRDVYEEEKKEGFNSRPNFMNNIRAKENSDYYPHHSVNRQDDWNEESFIHGNEHHTVPAEGGD
jgi:hypothetical protein